MPPLRLDSHFGWGQASAAPPPPGFAQFVYRECARVWARVVVCVTVRLQPCGRLGDARVLRVPSTGVLQSDAYEYFSGVNATGWPVWSPDPNDGVVVIPGPVGELSVVWLPTASAWLASFTAVDSTVVYRVSTTPCLWGEYSAPTTLLDFGR